MIVDKLVEWVTSSLGWVLSLLPQWSPWATLQNMIPYDVMRLFLGISSGFLTTFAIGVALWVLSWVRGMSK